MRININSRRWVKALFTVHCSLFISAALTACSSDDIVGDPARDWSGTTERFVSADENAFTTFYTPTVGRVGDPMPFYDQREGCFKVLYLQEYDNNMDKRFHPIWGVTTTDGCHYTSLGEVIPYGDNDQQQDAALGTGCCQWSEKDGLYYVYYTGHNGNCKNREVVMRATSPDFKTWTKDDLWALNGPDFGYSGQDFRDPQIFTADDGSYHMVVATYPTNGGDPVFAEFRSADMRQWEHVGHFKMIWDRFLECPDIFKMGSYWYLVYSEKVATPWSRKVKYMVGNSWDDLKDCFNNGPRWPQDGREGVLDSRAFYAGKTASDGQERFIWGWCPWRSGGDIDEKNISVGGEKDGEEPNWSGALVCHKVQQAADGTLTLVAVPKMAAKYDQQQEVSIMDCNGYADGTLTGDDAYVLYNRLGKHNHLALTVKTSTGWDKFGISLVRSTDPHYYYTMVFNPENENWRKVNFEQEGYIERTVVVDDKETTEKVYGKGFINGIDSYGFDRPADNTYNIDIYTDNSVMVMYVNDKVCYTQRIYGIDKNCWSVNNYGGSVTVSNVKVTQY
jgi:beta-fructofuranosidase